MIAFIKRREILLIAFVALIITVIFFYKTILHGQMPFPGDLLASESPYKSQSLLGYPPGGYPNIAQGVDVITEMLPWKYFVIQELKKGEIPFWNPHNFSGNVLMQNFQSAVFYPLNIVFFIFPFSSAWSIFIMLQPFFAIIFMYFFLRSLKLTTYASIIGAIAFGFSSYMTVWIEYGNIGSTILWLPLVLFFVQKFINSPKLSSFLLTIFALTMSFLAGYIQGVFYMYVISTAFVLYRCLPKRKNYKLSFWIHLCIIGILPICFALFQLLPTYDAFSSSTRNPYSLNQISNLLQPMYYWLTLFAPDFFGNPAHHNYFLTITYIERVMYFGIPLLFFTFFAIAKVKNKDMRFFLGIGLFVLITTANIPLIKYLYLLPIPMVSTTVPTRALSIFIFCTIIVGCYGIDYWIQQKSKERTNMPIYFIGIYILLWLSIIILAKLSPFVGVNRSVILHNLIIPTAIAFGTIVIFYIRPKKQFQKISLVALFILFIFDLFSFFQRITPFASKELLYPQTPAISFLKKNAGINRFWGYGQAYVLPNFQTYDGTYSTEGNDPLHNKDYGILLASSENGKYPLMLPRPDATITNTYGVNAMRNPFRQKLLNLLGVKYILFQNDSPSQQMQDRYDMFQPENYQLAWQDTSSWQIYENKTALPRFFLTSKYILAKDSKDALAKIYKTNSQKTLILQSKPSTSLDTHASGSVSLLNYAPNTIRFQTNTTGNTLLFLSDTYSPSWSGKIDARIAPIYKADLAFRAIEIPQGKHIVTFSYYPKYFALGIKIALAGLIFLICYSFYLYKYETKK